MTVPPPETGTRPDPRTARRAVRLAWFTIGYNLLEGVIAVSAGLVASAVSLVGFGLDSGIELAAAVVVLIRLSADLRGGEPDEAAQRRALQFIAVTFLALAGYVTIEGIRDLATHAHPGTSPVGIALTGASLIVMPVLAAAKRRAGIAMGSQLVVADAAETRLCALLSLSTFAGLLGYALAGWTWLDAVAGFVIAGFALVEAREAWAGELLSTDDD
ncbi:MAG TPA: cation transporter [Kineosporiaceae bacterium]|nr:cation transporter [Kineosporiaceae bacterium]